MIPLLTEEDYIELNGLKKASALLSLGDFTDECYIDTADRTTDFINTLLTFLADFDRKSPFLRETYSDFLHKLSTNGLPIYQTLVDNLNPKEHTSYDNLLLKFYLNNIKKHPEIQPSNPILISLIPNWENSSADLADTLCITLQILLLTHSTIDNIGIKAVNAIKEYYAVGAPPVHIQNMIKSYLEGSTVDYTPYCPDIDGSDYLTHSQAFIYTASLNVNKIMYSFEQPHISYRSFRTFFEILQDSIPSLIPGISMNLSSMAKMNHFDSDNLVFNYSSTISWNFIITDQSHLAQLQDICQVVMPHAIDLIVGNMASAEGFKDAIDRVINYRNLQDTLPKIEKGSVRTKI